MAIQTNTKTKKDHKIYWLIVATLFTGILCGITAGAFLGLTKDLPQIQALESFKPSAITRIYSADQILIGELYVERREPVPLSDIPDMLITALLTTEDRAFYEHSGIALRGIIRAAVKNVLRGRLSEGASTLTQQLARTLFLTPKKTFMRKLREAVLSLQLERRYTKDELLTLYLNQIYFGSGAYGVSMAVKTYFDKNIGKLTLSECALIAGLPQLPSRYSPLVNPHLAIKRRNIVLLQMLRTNSITKAQYEKAKNEPLNLRTKDGKDRKAPYFTTYVRGVIESTVGENLAYKGGLTVYTTLNMKLQAAAETAVANGLSQLQTRMRQSGIVQAVPQAALLALDIDTGGIISMVGGQGDQSKLYNRATVAKRQPGSSFKPIVYAKAIEQGFTQIQTLVDAPVVFLNPNRPEDWQPENFSHTYSGEVTLRWAMAHSKNIPAVRLIEKISPSAVIEFSQSLGIESILKPNLSLALGSSEVTLMELTAAYCVFANRGKYTKPYGVVEIRNDAGDTIWRVKPEQHIAMSQAAAAITTDMLKAVIEEGTGRKAKQLPGAFAGKTGTTNDYKDALFIGYSPSTSVGVWVGNDDATTLGPGETGAKAALPIWIEFMQHAVGHMPPSYFDIPDDVHYITVNPKTGTKVPPEKSGGIRALVKIN